jgi:hypothetical protein
MSYNISSAVTNLDLVGELVKTSGERRRVAAYLLALLQMHLQSLVPPVIFIETV